MKSWEVFISWVAYEVLSCCSSIWYLDGSERLHMSRSATLACSTGVCISGLLLGEKLKQNKYNVLGSKILDISHYEPSNLSCAFIIA